MHDGSQIHMSYFEYGCVETYPTNRLWYRHRILIISTAFTSYPIRTVFLSVSVYATCQEISATKIFFFPGSWQPIQKWEESENKESSFTWVIQLNHRAIWSYVSLSPRRPSACSYSSHPGRQPQLFSFWTICGRTFAHEKTKSDEQSGWHPGRTFKQHNSGKIIWLWRHFHFQQKQVAWHLPKIQSVHAELIIRWVNRISVTRALRRGDVGNYVFYIIPNSFALPNMYIYIHICLANK